MKTADFDFYLPKDLIALKPSEKRDNSRLLILHRDGGIEHRRFLDIVEYLKNGDMLLLNDTKVFPARLIAVKPSGGKIDILFVKESDTDGTWEIMYNGRFEGTASVEDGIKAEIWTEEDKCQVSGVRSQNTEKAPKPKKFLRFLNIDPSNVMNILWQYGYMPLPPYIKRQPDESDKQRYQTVYAENQGSIAAPTAGLHFTEELLKRIKDKGVMVEALTLHVGVGTFKPIKAEDVEGHKMDSEYFEVKSSLIEKIKETKESGKRVITVGTTATRALEGYFSGQFSTFRGHEKVNGLMRGYTDIFIYSGYKFKAVDSLITNFHLPCSTPLMLASAFCSFETLLKAYKEAIAMGYRFFSYGDAMLIL